MCGNNNKEVLKLKVVKNGDTATIRTKIDNKFQSFQGIVHGDIISLLIDEVLWYAFYFQGINCNKKVRDNI